MVSDVERLLAATRWTVEILWVPLGRKKRGWRPLGKPHRTVAQARTMALVAMGDVEVGASRIVQTYIKKGVSMKVR